MYRTNPNPDTDPWVITGAMKVNRILTRAEQAELVKNAGREPQQIQEGDIVTDDVVNSINQEIADAPKFSLKVYHGSGADFTEFDFDHMGDGAGSQVFGWGGYVTSSKKIGKSYANLVDANAPYQDVEYVGNNAHKYTDVVAGLFNGGQRDYDDVKEFLQNGYNADKQNARKKQMLEWFESTKPSDWKSVNDGKRNLYEVDIPEDNGSNYLEWEKKPSDEVATKIIEGLYGLDAKTLDDMASKDIVFRTLLYDYIKNADKGQMIPLLVKTHALTRGTTYDNGNVEDDIRFVYTRLSNWMGSPKAASQFLSSLGFTGIKYPAGTIMGGAEENDTNYVIFKPEDMRIIEHTKFSLRLKSAIEETETNPSDAQKESGNYKKGHIKFGGYDYTIENPKGSTRSGKDADGKEWKVTMADTYGYIRGKFGKDGDHLDMFINDKADLDNWNGDVFVVDQVNPDGSFDEHKVMYGYDSMDDAKKAYLANYSKGWNGLGNITGASKDEFDKWLDTSNRKLKPFADYAKVKFSLKDNQGNPLNQDGTLKLDKIKSVDELTDEDFTSAFRNVELPAIPKNVDAAIGANGKPVVIKKNIFEKNWNAHKFTPAESKKVLNDALYNTDLVGHTQPTKKPNHWVAIKLDDKSPITVLEVNDNKENVEVVGWYTLDERNLGRIKRQAERNGGELIMLTPKDDKVESLSTPPLSSAAKIDNSSETTKENGEKFSLKDEKTLAGVHNISEEKLLKAIKQGGLANPSVAVIDSSKQKHEGYGDISLILPSDKVAKRTGKNAGTWQGDAWTPTYPQVEKQISNKGSVQVNKDVLSVPKEMQREVRNGIDRWILDGNDSNSGLKYLFLHEKGVAPKMVELQHKYSDKVYNELKFITAGDFNISSIGKADTEKVLSMYIDSVFDGDRTAYDEKQKYRIVRYKKQVAEGEKNPFLLARAKSALEQYDKYGFYFDKVQEFVRKVERDHRMTGVNTDATLNEVEDYIKTNNLTDEFNTWLEGKEKEYGVKEVIFDGFTPSGNRRYVPNTLENVSKIMKKQGRNGATGSAVSFQNFAARLMPSYGTLKDIRSKKGLLTSDREEFDKFRDKWSGVFYELGMKCQPDATGTFEFYGLERLSEAAMTSDPQAYLKKEYNVDFSDEDTKRLKEMVKAIKEEQPAMYFETKFERPVGFNEFSSAVVPSTASNEVKQALQNAGVQIYEYDKEKEGDRSRAFNEAINSSDNIRFSLKEEKEKIIADAKANGTYMTAPNGEKTKLDAEQWATVRTINFKNWFGDWENDPENASKVLDENGEPMVVWHGRSAEFNTFEKKEGVRFIMGLEDKVKAEGFFFSPDKGLAEEFASNSSRHRGGKANVVPCFLNIRRPMDLTGEDYDRIYEDVTGWEYMVGMDTQDNLWGIMDEEGMADKIKEKGYDGAIFVEEVDDSYEPTKISYCALDANQIKSAENNNGDFSADNNDIRFSLAGERGAADMAEELKSLNTPDEVDDAIKTAIEDMPSGWQMANKKMIHVAQALGENRKAEIAGEEPKFSLKDGTLIKAGTYFSGGGLVEEGLKGIIDPVLAVEYDEKISGVYRNNFGQHIVTADVRDVDPKELVKQIDGEVEYFHASPVCKNYSQAKSNHTEVELDKETAASTAEFINAIKPKVVTIENVKGYKDSDAMKNITDALDANGYTWDADV